MFGNVATVCSGIYSYRIFFLQIINPLLCNAVHGDPELPGNFTVSQHNEWDMGEFFL